MVGADSDDRRGDVIEDESTCVVESGEDMVDTNGTKSAAGMAVLSCNDPGFEETDMYGRADPEDHQRQGHSDNKTMLPTFLAAITLKINAQNTVFSIDSRHRRLGINVM
jgi:hypothetical protein